MIRYATPEDLPTVFKMYCDALKELGDEYEPQDAFEYMCRCYDHAPCILLEDDGIIGFAGLYTYAPLYNRKKVYLREYMFYILPKHRGVKSWRSLCKGVQETADKFNLTFVGEHRLQGSIKHHERLIRMAGAKPYAIISTYGEKNE